MSISARITAFLVAQKIVPAEDNDIYEYGFELLLADLFNFSVILLIGGISGHLWPSVLYLLIFVGLRSVCGGYHAKTHLRCRISTIGVFVLFLVLFHIRPLADGGPLLLWGDIIASVPVILFAPIPHANKPLSETVRKRNRRLAILLYFALVCAAALLGQFGRQESIVISLTLWIVSLCMIPAIDVHSFARREKI